MVLTFYGYVEPIDAYFPELQPLSGVAGESLELGVEVVAPEPDTTVASWSIDGQPLAVGGSATVEIAVECLDPGEHEVVVEVHDATTLVRSDPDALLAQSLQWSLTRTDEGEALDCPELFGSPDDGGPDASAISGKGGGCNCNAATGGGPTRTTFLALIIELFA
jgi:hypothetical protein